MFLEILKSIFLGVIEGVTEFLPISSTGHLILANQWIAFSETFTQKFDVIIQLGAILAVVVIYWKKLIPNKESSVKKTMSLWMKTVVAVIPALFFGALFNDKIEELLFNPITVAIALIFWGIVLVVIEKFKIKMKIESTEKLGYGRAFLIGIAQCLAMIPGTSRSAMTIISAMLIGSSRAAAVEFSFFLAIPTMVAATGYSILKMGFNISSTELVTLIVGFVTSFVVALLVIRFFLSYITKKDFRLFGYYRIILGILVLAYFL